MFTRLGSSSTRYSAVAMSISPRRCTRRPSLRRAGVLTDPVMGWKRKLLTFRYRQLSALSVADNDHPPSVRRGTCPDEASRLVRVLDMTTAARQVSRAAVSVVRVTSS